MLGSLILMQLAAHQRLFPTAGSYELHSESGKITLKDLGRYIRNFPSKESIIRKDNNSFKRM